MSHIQVRYTTDQVSLELAAIAAPVVDEMVEDLGRLQDRIVSLVSSCRDGVLEVARRISMLFGDYWFPVLHGCTATLSCCLDPSSFVAGMLVGAMVGTVAMSVQAMKGYSSFMVNHGYECFLGGSSFLLVGGLSQAMTPSYFSFLSRNFTEVSVSNFANGILAGNMAVAIMGKVISFFDRSMQNGQ